jgi:hypothetical protein
VEVLRNERARFGGLPAESANMKTEFVGGLTNGEILSYLHRTRIGNCEGPRLFYSSRS